MFSKTLERMLDFIERRKIFPSDKRSHIFNGRWPYIHVISLINAVIRNLFLSV